MTGKETFKLVTEQFGMELNNLRLTCGYREIHPNETVQN